MTNRFIRDYSTIRKVLEKIYIYGFMGREDFVKTGFSGRSYDNEISRLCSIYSEKVMIINIRGKKSYYRFKKDKFKTHQNDLINTYLLKNFSSYELSMYIIITSILKNSPSGLKFIDILKRIECSVSLLRDKDIKSTLLRRLKEMVDYGAISINQNKNLIQYCLADSFFEKFTSDELVSLNTFVSFMSNVLFPRVPGIHFLRTLKRYMEVHKIYKENEIFLYLHNHHHNIIDEEIAYQIIELINMSKSAIMEYQYSDDLKETKEVCPVKVTVDVKLGRWYFMGTCNEDADIFRLTRVLSVKAGKKFDYEKAKHICDKAFLYNGLSSSKRDTPYLIKAELVFEKNPYIKEKFLREMTKGIIEAESAAKLLYTVEINDPIELLPWLRSYGEFIRILSGDHGLHEHLKEEYKGMLISYGVV